MTLRTQIIKKIARPFGITTGEIAKQLRIPFSEFKRHCKKTDPAFLDVIEKIFGVRLKITS